MHTYTATTDHTLILGTRYYVFQAGRTYRVPCDVFEHVHGL